MSTPAERMKAMRDRRRARGLREVRLLVPDLRQQSVRREIARQVRNLDPADEEEALRWIESVSEFDNPSEDPADPELRGEHEAG
jgi:hypothetical protein